MATSMDATMQGISQPIVPMTLQEEENVIHARTLNDEKSLRRVTKKFHSYTSMAYNPVMPPSPTLMTSVDDARDAFLIELASFHLTLKKSLLVCEAEARQVEEYYRERGRIENERDQLKEEIEELKVSLEQAHIQRRRKIEYDAIAEKINTLPSREELEHSIRALEGDIAAIQHEQEESDRILHAQQNAVVSIIASIQNLRELGRADVDSPDESQAPTSPPATQGAELADADVETHTRMETGEIAEDRKSGPEERASEVDTSLSNVSLNATARPFIPGDRVSTPTLASGTATPVPRTTGEEDEDDDIEMGELAEEPKERALKKKTRYREELEEGEASDLSSELSELPDD